MTDDPDNNTAALVSEFHARVLDYETSNERLRDEVTRLRLQVVDLSDQLRQLSGDNDRLRRAIVGADIDE
jgi:predicted ATP-grasp superfamily ATP-dependent carboligase